MNPGEVLLWMADHLDIWRPAAVMVLAAFAGGCLYFAALAWTE